MANESVAIEQLDHSCSLGEVARLYWPMDAIIRSAQDALNKDPTDLNRAHSLLMGLEELAGKVGKISGMC